MENLNKLALEIEAERELLNNVVDNIGIFVDKYKYLKTLLDGFVETNKYDLSNEFTKIKETTTDISENLDNMRKSLSNFNNDYSSNFKALSSKMDSITSEFSETFKSQTKINDFVNKIESFMKIISIVDFDGLKKGLNKNSQEIVNIKNIVDELEKNIKRNNDEVTIVTTSIKNLIEQKDNQQNLLENITKQLVNTNEILNKISKQNNIDTAVLFSLMDEWIKNKKKRK